MRSRLLAFILFLPGILFAQSPVTIDYFYEPGCPDCLRVQRDVEPELRNQFETFYALNRWDLGIQSNVIRLVTYQEELGVSTNAPVMMVVDYRHVLNGYPVIKAELLGVVEQAVLERQKPSWRQPEPIAIPSIQNGLQTASERVKGLALGVILANGLADGLNPCAISTLVFFMSLLAVAKVRGRDLLLMGISYCLASFLTYLALGFGLLRVIRTFRGYPLIRELIDISLFVMVIVLAFLSFRDAWRYKHTGNPASVTLQIPDRFKTAIHSVMRGGVGAGSMVLGGFGIGLAVTVLESVCTGQMYLPTLVLVVESGAEKGRALAYLITYNLMFILPLVTVFILAYLGLRTETLLRWSKSNVVVSKIALGCLFLVMAALMVLL